MNEDNPYQNDRFVIKQLLNRYENLKIGKGYSFLDEDSFEKVINYFQEKEDLSKAAEAADLALGQYPFSAQLLIRKAEILLSGRHFQEALDQLEKAALFDSSDIDLYILKTDIFLALDQHEKAAEILKIALDKFEEEERADFLFELADVYDNYEEYEKVFGCLKWILEDDPNNEEALYKICFWADFTGLYEESIRLHQQIIDEYPYNELAWFNLAAAYQGLKLYEKSIDAYQYAIAIDEKFDYAYRNMGDALIRLRKYREAIEVLEKVTELSRPEDVIYEALGFCYEKSKNYAQARFYYRKASHMRPDDSRLYYKLASTYYYEKRWEACLKQLETALRIHPTYPEYCLMAGECKSNLGQRDDAICYLLLVVQNRPKYQAGREALIRCLYQAGYWDDALIQSREALINSGGKALYRYYQAAVLMSMGKVKEALIELENALQQAPKMLKKFIELNPSVLQRQAVVDLLARYKRNKSI